MPQVSKIANVGLLYAKYKIQTDEDKTICFQTRKAEMIKCT